MSALLIGLGDACATDRAAEQRADETQVERARGQGHESDRHKDESCSRATLRVAPGDETGAGDQTRDATGWAIYESSEAGSAEVQRCSKSPPWGVSGRMRRTSRAA